MGPMRHEDRDVQGRGSQAPRHERRVRLSFLGIILVLPWLIVAWTAEGPAAWAGRPDRLPGSLPESIAAVCLIEGVVVLGLLFVTRQRRRILTARQAGSEVSNSSAPRLGFRLR